MPQFQPIDEKSALKKAQQKQEDAKQGETAQQPAHPLKQMQQLVGNTAVQRLLAQRSGTGPTEVDNDTAEAINRQRGGGRPLEGKIARKAGRTMGADFSGVNVHTDGQANQLANQLGAKAFTTGNDIFFRDGAYRPRSSDGQQLIAHELTHVVQQGAAGTAVQAKMTVNDPNDKYEVEADRVADQPDAIPTSVRLSIIPNLNPDASVGRQNPNGVDLNRNWSCRWTGDARIGVQPVSGGSKAHSESETMALKEYLNGLELQAVLVWDRVNDNAYSNLVSPGRCTASEADKSNQLAKIYAAEIEAYTDEQADKASSLTGDITDSIRADYKIPSVFVLLGNGSRESFNDHLPAMLEVMKAYGG
ncbi:MAG: DUF4157 domain-containing protein [Chloroflexota bacterium]